MRLAISRGYPGMPEVGNMPLPRKLLQRGVKDMVRISDSRMSETAYGAVVLNASPEAAVGGPLALVQNGDMIELDVAARRLRLDVSDDELERRRAKWRAPPPVASSGNQKLYIGTVMQTAGASPTLSERADAFVTDVRAKLDAADKRV